MLRSIIAVLAGMAVWAILWRAAAFGGMAASPGSFGPEGGTTDAALLIFFLIWAAMISFLAGRITGAIHSDRAAFLGKVLATVQLAVGIVVQTIYWDVVSPWFSVLLILLLWPAHYAGAVAARPNGEAVAS